MELNNIRIHIVGAGISGLVAALELEKEGFSPTIWEASNRGGGRLKTDNVDGYQLDHGFQVLLDQYPKVKSQLSLDDLALRKFAPGAMIYHEKGTAKWGDPFRDIRFWKAPFDKSITTPLDLIRLQRLRKMVKQASLMEIFDHKEISTLNYLEQEGFSKRIVERFFKPFYAGIFLEDELSTSNRMFEFVFKMFAEGDACIPKAGMQAIVQQLLDKLKKTTIHYGAKIDRIEGDNLVLEGIDKIETDYILVATEASKLIPKLSDQALEWKSCHNFYYEVDHTLFSDPLIALQAKTGRLINNFHFPQNLNPASKGKKELISLTVVNDRGLSESDLRKKVESELKNDLSYSAYRLIKHYSIKRALPQIPNLKNDIDYTATQLKPNLFLAGDLLLNGSLNAAMSTGERAAEAISNRIKGIST
ncbi:MAG: FAD-dependent oxidoreductase [Vicingaceae bacterium]